jgi:hypothetical protein
MNAVTQMDRQLERNYDNVLQTMSDWLCWWWLVFRSSGMAHHAAAAASLCAGARVVLRMTSKQLPQQDLTDMQP